MPCSPSVFALGSRSVLYETLGENRFASKGGWRRWTFNRKRSFGYDVTCSSRACWAAHWVFLDLDLLMLFLGITFHAK